VRPLRDYWFVFTHEVTNDTVEVPGTGITPCAAKTEAFNRLSRKLKERQLPRSGWHLSSQSRLT